MRWATSQENNSNATKTQTQTSSKCKVVCWKKQNNTWTAQLKMNTKTMNLGYFNDEKDAARAFNVKALELFSDYANRNELSDNE